MSAEGQWVPIHCPCESKGGQYLKHYDVVRCSCGKFFWALQPKRNGPLKAFPWPGRNLTRAELEEKEGNI